MALAEGAGNRKDLLSPGAEYTTGLAPAGRHFADIFENVAARHHAAAGDYLFRVHGARASGGAQQRQPERAADVRLRKQLHSHADFDGTGRFDAVPIRWKVARGLRGY